MEIPYTVNDLYVLKSIVQTETYSGYRFHIEVLEKIKEELRERELSGYFILDTIRDWVMHHKFSNTKEIISFLFYTKLDKVPLFINDPNLKLFAKWRLKIGK